jgi:acyl-CoA synthetase (AMP-forming)/AMP-acid ligase II
MSVDLYVSILGTLRLGAVCVFADPSMGARAFGRCCASAAPVVFIGSFKAHLFRFLCPELGRVRLRAVAGGLPAWFPAIAGTASLSAWIRRGSGLASHPPVPVDLGDTALVTFTTGSSGVPKGSRRTHGFLHAQLEALDVPEKRACDVDFPGFPILPLENLARGRTTVIPSVSPGKVRHVDVAVVWGQLRRWKPSMLSGSPAYLEALADASIRAGKTDDTARVVYTGGAPVTGAALGKFAMAWPRAAIRVVYGSTEAEPVAVADAEALRGAPAERARRGFGLCVGHPVAGISVRILPLEHDAADEEDLDRLALPPGVAGQLVVHGAHVNEGYWNDAAAERANKIRTAEGIWHRMGDAGYLDGEGRLWLVGRVHAAMRHPDPASATPLIFPYQAELAADEIPGVRKSAYLQDGAGRFHLVVDLQRGADREAIARDIKSALDFLPLDRVSFPKVPVDPRHNSKVEYAVLRALLEKESR